MQSLLLLLPDFSLILLGVVLRRHLLTADELWAAIEKLVYFVLFPALLFNVLASAPIDFSSALPLFGSGFAVLLAGFALGWLGRPLMGLPAVAFASRLQCAYRFNTYIAIAIAGKLHGTLGVATMGALGGAMVPLANILAVSMLARHGQGNPLRELARNPLVLATLAGLAFNAGGLELADPVQSFLKRLGDAAVALGLLAVGAALRWGKVGGRLAGSCWLLAVKLMMMPALAWWLGRALGIEGVAFDILVLFAALPTASSAYILAMRMGGDGPGVAWLISASTLLAVGSLSFWLNLLG
ncbi:AEC family transporter [Pseudothauera nasutitermitis]|uniref:AEC family transporter n=1 Tax=Pseudothauera nasutitermitis TaxID=2565930 RepID=A0A4S4AWC6_9RHOO|nr:AEC family transporter [Pseudothauera nasutitermitis]THF63930.1 AEC family transporter [Pseudothauera nasutitermitis]